MYAGIVLLHTITVIYIKENIMCITIGCDPEFFVQNKGKFVCAHGLVAGTKHEPCPVNNGAVQVDGYALEFNINPARSPEEFSMYVEDVIGTLRRMVDKKYKFVLGCPTADFSPEYMAKQCAEANELGCDPDYNAWTGKKNIKPNASLPMRTAAGHIHIGWEGDKDAELQMAMVRQMDCFLGLPSLFYDGDTRRREMYGKASCFRFKPYGVEYRTLSNAWLKSKELMEGVCRNAIIGAECLLSGDLDLSGMDVQDIINTNDKECAKAIIDECGIPMIGG